MASQSNHWEQGEHNQELAVDLAEQSPLKYKDWAVITAFYASVHYVEAYLSLFGVHCNKNIKENESPHGYRKRMVMNFLPELEVAYRELHNNSNTVRYLINNAESTPKGDIYTEKDIDRLVKEQLKQIKDNAWNKIQEYNRRKTS